MERGFISPDTFMEGWTKEAMVDQINEVFGFKISLSNNKIDIPSI